MNRISQRRMQKPIVVVIVLSVLLLLNGSAVRTVGASQPTFDITTLKGKVASLYSTAGLQIRFSAFIEEEAQEPDATPASPTPINPAFVLSSPLDGTSV